MTADSAAVSIQIVIDCRDPNALADFWAAALHYEKQWDCAASPDTEWCAVVDHAGRGPRIVFQRVREAKAVKNRVHLDMQVGQGHAEAEVQRLLMIGATTVAGIEPAGPGLHRRTIMRDPEGNEFCVQ
jgi:Glyoxalase-like domain